MSDFDDLVRNDRSGESRSDRTINTAGGASNGSTPKKSSAASASVASMFGASDMAELSRRFNLDPDMNERVLVPLVNFLEKYGVADAVDSSPTANRLLNLAEFWNDIAPVIKNASDFFGGRKNQLDDSDREFLERIRAAQNETADLSLFQSDSDSSESVAAGGSATGGISIGESIGSAPATPPEPAPEPPKDPFKEPASVDWYEMMGAPNPANSKNHYETSALNTRPQTQFGINGLEQLAREAGLSVEEVMNRDSQNKINRKASDGVDYTAEGGIPNFQQGIDKIQSQMAAEAEHHRRNSKVSYEDLPTPESAETYNPLAVEGLTLPSLTGGGLESVDSLAAKAGVNPEELKPQPVGSRDPEPEEVSLEEIEEAHSIPEVSVPVSPAQPSAETFLVNFDEYEVAED